MTLVALSGAYGAGGSRIGRMLADRLGVPFLDRAIPAAVAEELAVPLDDAQAHDERLGGGGRAVPGGRQRLHGEGRCHDRGSVRRARLRRVRNDRRRDYIALFRNRSK